MSNTTLAPNVLASEICRWFRSGPATVLRDETLELDVTAALRLIDWPEATRTEGEPYRSFRDITTGDERYYDIVDEFECDNADVIDIAHAVAEWFGLLVEPKQGYPGTYVVLSEDWWASGKSHYDRFLQAQNRITEADLLRGYDRGGAS